MNVRLVNKTVGATGTEYENKSIDEIIVGIARLSSGRETNELFDEPHKLLRHCLSNGHWSIFGTCNLGFEIVTSRAIGRELLRHWSLSPQEISQRYCSISKFEPIELREQCENNRQSSSRVIDPILDGYYNNGNFKLGDDQASNAVENYLALGQDLYQDLQKNGVARESARFVLPEATQTTLVFNGKIRDWITTLNQRLHKSAQKECRKVAEDIRDIFIEECPIISKMLFNFEDAKEIHLLDKVLLAKYGVFDMVKVNNFKKIK